jgi:paraquat-inducible protein B
VRLEAGDRKQLQVRARVLVAAYPQRFLDVLADPQELTGGKALTPALRKSIIEQLVARGLRAQLRTGNLLTGQLYVALDYATNPANARGSTGCSEPPVFPVVKGGLTDIEAKLTSILGKLERLPIDAIGSELKQSLATLGETLKNVDTLVKRWGRRADARSERDAGRSAAQPCGRRRRLRCRRQDDGARLGNARGTARDAGRSEARRAVDARADRLSRAPSRRR